MWRLEQRHRVPGDLAKRVHEDREREASLTMRETRIPSGYLPITLRGRPLTVAVWAYGGTGVQRNGFRDDSELYFSGVPAQEVQQCHMPAL